MDVSVIIPSYQRADLLPEAIDSVLAQKLAPRELIVVDDGSSDDTEAVVARYGARVRYLKQANAGVGAARNHGVREARGRWVAFLDSDDCWLPHFLGDCDEALRRLPTARLAYAATWRWSGKNRLPGGIIGEPAGAQPLERLLRLKTLCTSSSVIIEREALIQAGGFREDRELGPSADWECWTRLAAAGTPFAYSRRPAVLIRVHPSNMLSDPARMEIAMIRAVDCFVDGRPEAERARLREILHARVTLRSAVGFYGIGQVRVARRKLLEAATKLPSIVVTDRAWSWTLARSLLGARISSGLRRLRYRKSFR